MRTVAVVGGGQLGLMLGLAGSRLDLRFRFLDPSPDAPAGRVGALRTAAFDDPRALAELVEPADAITYEFENFPAAAAPPWLRPSARSLATGQDRLAEKRLFERLGIGTAPFAPVDDHDGLARAVAAIGLPAVLKTRRLGYDGKGQAVLHGRDDVDAAWSALGGVPLLLEGLVAFRRELSVVAVRAADGETVFYPLTENAHRDGILRVSRAPAAPELQEEAGQLAAAVLEELDHVGVLAIELFDAGGRLLANELAPRVHNSGHWTIDGAPTSQFENHLRAILDLPLGATEPVGAATMVNLIGAAPPLAELLAVPGARVHLYGKSPRPGRKVGHVTLVGPDARALEPAVEQLERLAADGATARAAGRP